MPWSLSTGSLYAEVTIALETKDLPVHAFTLLRLLLKCYFSRQMFLSPYSLKYCWSLHRILLFFCFIFLHGNYIHITLLTYYFLFVFFPLPCVRKELQLLINTFCKEWYLFTNAPNRKKNYRKNDIVYCLNAKWELWTNMTNAIQ